MPRKFRVAIAVRCKTMKKSLSLDDFSRPPTKAISESIYERLCNCIERLHSTRTALRASLVEHTCGAPAGDNFVPLEAPEEPYEWGEVAQCKLNKALKNALRNGFRRGRREIFWGKRLFIVVNTDSNCNFESCRNSPALGALAGGVAGDRGWWKAGVAESARRI